MDGILRSNVWTRAEKKFNFTEVSFIFVNFYFVLLQVMFEIS